MAKGTEMVARFKPGENVPVYANSAGNIVAGRFVTIVGRNAKNAFIGRHTGAGEYASGVAERDAIQSVTDHRGGTNIVGTGSYARVVAGAAIDTSTGPVAVKSDSTGRAIPQGGSGVIIGYALGRDDTGGPVTAAGQIATVKLA